MRTIKFETTFHSELQGCKNEKNLHKIAIVELPIPENINITDGYELTTYIEKTTKLFVLNILPNN